MPHTNEAAKRRRNPTNSGPGNIACSVREFSIARRTMFGSRIFPTERRITKRSGYISRSRPTASKRRNSLPRCSGFCSSSEPVFGASKMGIRSRFSATMELGMGTGLEGPLTMQARLSYNTGMKTKLSAILALACIAGTPAPAPPVFPNYSEPQPAGTQDIQVSRILIAARCARCDSQDLRISVVVNDIVQGHGREAKAMSMAEFAWKCRACGSRWNRSVQLK